MSEPTSSAAAPARIRVATVQYQQGRIDGLEAFLARIEYFVSVAAGYRADFVVFPELITLQLLSAGPERLSPAAAMDVLTAHAPRFEGWLRTLAVRHRINIIGGSHPSRQADGEVRNVCHVALRDGQLHARTKIHPTPSERDWWDMKGGSDVNVIDTDCGKVGVLICYDSEFPELARRLADQGARVLFVPFCTDTLQGYLRVRYCAQARTIENQCYAVLSGNVGNLPGVEMMDVNHAQSCVLTPCDFPFPRDGVAALAADGVETVLVADLDLSALDWARTQGTVRNLADRRHDLYRVEWSGGGAD